MIKEKLTFLFLGSGISVIQILPRLEAICPAQGNCTAGCAMLGLPLLAVVAVVGSRLCHKKEDDAN